MLQCRNGKRTAKASVKIAVDMVKEGTLTETEALLRIPANQMDFFLHPTLDPSAKKVWRGGGREGGRGGEGRGLGGEAFSFFVSLDHLTIDHAALSRRSILPLLMETPPTRGRFVVSSVSCARRRQLKKSIYYQIYQR